MVLTSLIETLHGTDQQVTLFINSLDNPILDHFWIFMSNMYVWIPFYVICFAFLFKRLGWKKALIVIASIALAFGLCDQISNVVKHAVERLRPCYDEYMVSNGLNILEKKGGQFGFFSAHAANAFAFITCCLIGFRNDRTHTYKAFAVCGMLWAALVGISRIFVGKHFLGDVLVGTIFGLFIGYLAGILARYIIQKFIDKKKASQS